MKCESVENLVLDADEKLTDAQLQQIRSHLDQCSECRTLFAAHEKLLNSIPDTEFSPEHQARLNKSVLEKIGTGNAAQKAVSEGFIAKIVGLLAQPSYAASFLVVLMLVGWAVIHLSGTKPGSANLPVIAGSFKVIVAGQHFEKQGEYALKAGETLQIPVGQPCKITLAEGQQIAATGEFKLNLSQNQIQIQSADGQLEFATKGRPVMVTLPDFAFSVRSTTVKILVNKDINQVFMVKGSIEIIRKDGSRQILTEGKAFAMKAGFLIRENKMSETKIENQEPAQTKPVETPVKQEDANQNDIQKQSDQIENSNMAASESVDLPTDTAPAATDESSVGNLDNAF